MKKVYDLNIKKFLVFFIFNTLMLIFVNVLILFIYNINFLNQLPFKRYNFILVFFLILFICFVILINFFDKFKFYKIIFIPKNFLILFLLNFLLAISVILQNYFLSQATGFNLSFYDNLYYSLVISLSILISITPNALGLRELLVYYIGNFGNDISPYLVNFSIADRLLDLTVLALVFAYYTFKGVNIFALLNNK